MKAERYILCRTAARLLNAGLLVILGLIIHITQLFESASQASSGILYITAQCKAMTECALATLVILVGGVLLLDCVYKGKIR